MGKTLFANDHVINFIMIFVEVLVQADSLVTLLCLM